MKRLIIGIGNTARQDDALGWRAAEALADDFTVVHFVYQLQIEDAELISHYEEVLIVDSSIRYYPDGFKFYPCKADDDRSFTTHSVSPQALLWLCQTCFNKHPIVFVLEISGYEWELKESLSKVAAQNLKLAIESVHSRITQHPAHT